MKNIFKLFLILALSVVAQNSAFADYIKFAQVADAHFSLNNNYKEKVLKSTIEDINNQSDLEFVIFTGDNIDSAKEKDLVGFMQIIKKLNKPYYIVIGNHDVFKSGGLSKLRYMEVVNENSFLPKPSKPNYVFKKKDFVFIVVDGAKEVIPGSNGYYKADTLEWLEQQLIKYKKSTVVICQHFPLIAPRNEKSHETYQAEKYLELLGKYDNVKAVIAGHYHINSEKMQDGIYHISSPTLLNEPNSYKIIEIVTTKDFSPMIYTRLREVPMPENTEK